MQNTNFPEQFKMTQSQNSRISRTSGHPVIPRYCFSKFVLPKWQYFLKIAFPGCLDSVTHLQDPNIQMQHNSFFRAKPGSQER